MKVKRELASSSAPLSTLIILPLSSPFHSYLQKKKFKSSKLLIASYFLFVNQCKKEKQFNYTREISYSRYSYLTAQKLNKKKK